MFKLKPNQYTIRELRIMTGLSQRKFCEIHKIPIRTLQSWEQGWREPSEYVLDLIYDNMQMRTELGLEGGVVK